jgi:hypothetical protein
MRVDRQQKYFMISLPETGEESTPKDHECQKNKNPEKFPGSVYFT